MSASVLNPALAPWAGQAVIRALSAQIDLPWTQEEALFARYRDPAPERILEAGCGPGVGTHRLAELFPATQVLGVDAIDADLELARLHYSHLEPRVAFVHEDLRSLRTPGDSFDLTVCRDVPHSLPQVQGLLRELIRVTRGGGHLHLVAEDYGMLCFNAPQLREFWHTVSETFGWNSHTDVYGRRLVKTLTALRMKAINLDYLVVDPNRVVRQKMIGILEEWRLCLGEAICGSIALSRQSVQALFDDSIAEINDSRQYVTGLVPVVSARVRKVGASAAA
jgi:ubiquinone/menaquinone biosynthesis C-methylase UbiE